MSRIGTPSRPGGLWSTLLVGIVLSAGILARGVVFEGSHREGDEVLYRALMQQMRAGKGYTLRGHPVLSTGWFSREVYDKPVFPQHPPGGILLFLACDQLTPGSGASTAQILSFSLFCAGILLMGRALERGGRPTGAIFMAIASAFSPIAAHVAVKQWLDAPLLGFATLGSGFYLLGVRRRRWSLVLAGGAFLCYACWIKLTAIGMFPWLLILSVVMENDDRARFAWRSMAVLVLSALAAVLPWQLWLSAHGMGIGAAARPGLELLQTNRYVRFITLERSPLVYLTLTPLVLWTLWPSALLLALHGRRRTASRVQLGLAAWVAGTLLTYVCLGAIGYSKLLRYAILVTPGAILLFSSLAGDLLKRHVPVSRTGWRFAAGLVFVGLGLEIVQGIHLTLQRSDALIVSIAPLLLDVVRKALAGAR
jgi:4-amino-4-deoxy-L-arabinose transferase-like glycosyltransferase